MFDRDEESYLGRFEQHWRGPTPYEASSPARKRWLDRLGRDLHVAMRNEAETRRFLAQEVYRIPEVWLDDVLRLRLADLNR